MKYVVESTKTVEQLSEDLRVAVANNSFGVLHMHDLKAIMNAKGVEFKPACRVFEVCNPNKANALLTDDISLNMMLPCRISIWQDGDTIKLGTLKPTALLSVLSDSQSLKSIAEEVEEKLLAIIDEAR
jgi:uncharacterized protein (DUF302 family)